jgi:ribosomal protein L13
MSVQRFSKPLWHLVDAKDKLVGRLACQITHILQGKHKPSYSPNYDCGDYVGESLDLRFILILFLST